MNIEELESALVDILGDDFSIEEDDQGQLVVYTGLRRADDSEDDDDLIEFISEDETEEDLDIDPDQESLDALEEDEE